jgi:myo-inositol-1(or 4)-monophosphatase
VCSSDLTAFGLLCAAPGIHAAAVERLTPRAREILGQPQS